MPLNRPLSGAGEMRLRDVAPRPDRRAEALPVLQAWTEAGRFGRADDADLAALRLDETDTDALLSDPQLGRFRREVARGLGTALFSDPSRMPPDARVQDAQRGPAEMHYPPHYERLFPRSFLDALAEHEAVRYFVYSLTQRKGEGCHEPFRVLRALDTDGSEALLRNSVARCVLLHVRGLEQLGQNIVARLSEDQKAHFFDILRDASGIDQHAFTEACVMAIEGDSAFPEYAPDLERASLVGTKGFVPRFQFQRMARACGYATEDAFFASLTPDARRAMQASYVRECATARLDGDRLLHLLGHLPNWASEIRDQAIQAIHDRVVTGLLEDPAHAAQIAETSSWRSVITRYFAEDEAASFCRRYARLGESIQEASPASVGGYALLVVQMDRCGYSLEDIQSILRQTMAAYPEDAGEADERWIIVRAVCTRHGRPGEALERAHADRAMAHIGYDQTDAYDVHFRSGEKASVRVWIAREQRREDDVADGS